MSVSALSWLLLCSRTPLTSELVKEGQKEKLVRQLLSLKVPGKVFMEEDASDYSHHNVFDSLIQFSHDNLVFYILWKMNAKLNYGARSRQSNFPMIESSSKFMLPEKILLIEIWGINLEN